MTMATERGHRERACSQISGTAFARPAFARGENVNGGAADPPAPDPPLCVTDHPPAYTL
jgi:hypothetical protein